MIFFLFILFINGIFLKLIDNLICERFDYSFLETIQERQSDMRNKYSILFIVLFGPLMEELMFRLPIVLNRINIQISICTLSLYFVGDKIAFFSFDSALTWIKLIPIVIIVCFGKHLLLDSHLLFIKKNFFKTYFVLLCLFFGLVHLTNFYNSVPNHLLIYSPIFTIPQIILGFFVGYLRLKKGFMVGLVFHCLYNFIIVALNHL